MGSGQGCPALRGSRYRAAPGRTAYACTAQRIRLRGRRRDRRDHRPGRDRIGHIVRYLGGRAGHPPGRAPRRRDRPQAQPRRPPGRPSAPGPGRSRRAPGKGAVPCRADGRGRVRAAARERRRRSRPGRLPALRDTRRSDGDRRRPRTRPAGAGRAQRFRIPASTPGRTGSAVRQSEYAQDQPSGPSADSGLIAPEFALPQLLHAGFLRYRNWWHRVAAKPEQLSVGI